MKKSVENQNDLLKSLEHWFEKYNKVIFIAIIGLFSLLSLMLFNLRISEGGDDSTYLIRAANFIDKGSYPSFQGPFYPLFLSIFIGLFGIKLGLIKLTSFVALLAGVILFYRIFRKRISYTLLFATLLISCVSSAFIYFSSQTYSEAVFFLLQLPIFALVFNEYEDKSDLINWKRLSLLSLVLVAGYLTRTVGIGSLIAVVVFFIFRKDYKKSVLVILGFVVFLFAFLLVKSAIWQNGLFDEGQVSTLLYKHPYQLEKGKETFGGFLNRFVDNSNLYLSKHFLKMVGLRADSIKSVNGWYTIFLYVLFIIGAYQAFRKNKYLFFTTIYVAVMLGITFFALQKLWDQYRLIIPFFPFMVLVMVYTLVYLAKQSKGALGKRILVLFVIICFGSSLFQTFSKVDLLTLRKNLKGDLYEGYTDDWRNYLSMTEYVGKELSENAFAAVRKPNMAQVYGNGKKFYGIYRYNTEDPDKLLKRLKDNGVTHVIMASLRKNPAVNNGQTINTIQRYLYIIAKKYPQVFKLEYQIGGKVEPAYLFRVDYAATQFVNERSEHTNNNTDESK